MNPSVAVITPTIGSEHLSQNIESVRTQSYKNLSHYIYVDGSHNLEKVQKRYSECDTTRVTTTTLPLNVGKVGERPFYGHRVYAAAPFLINADYVIYLDEDNWLEPNHVEECVKVMEGKDWCYSLRNIKNSDGTQLCEDNCESLGKWQGMNGAYHIDTSCYCLRIELAMEISRLWHNGSYKHSERGSYGADRPVAKALMEQVKNYECTGLYSVNYRLDGNANSASKDFFLHYNKMSYQKHHGAYPWSKKISVK